MNIYIICDSVGLLHELLLLLLPAIDFCLLFCMAIPAYGRIIARRPYSIAPKTRRVDHLPRRDRKGKVFCSEKITDLCEFK